MPPVGAKVSAFSVTSDRMTASSHSPSGRARAAHSAQKRSVCSSDDSGSTALGGGRCDEPWVNTNVTDSPAATSKSPTVVRSSPRSATAVCSVTMSGPAMARMVPSGSRVTHGTVRP